MGTSPCVQFTELLGWGLLNTLHNWIHRVGLYISVKNCKQVVFKAIYHTILTVQRLPNVIVNVLVKGIITKDAALDNELQNWQI